MKSAYGMTIPPEDAELTHVGPGTPCGELLRRYWHPVCLSDDLGDLPKRVRILGEDLVAFRDGKGRVGLMFYRCSHRGTSLEYGRVEGSGLRCCYHGWLYDVEGKVLEMPLQTEAGSRAHEIQHPCYPVREQMGLVFAYMGPLEKMPLLPRYDIWADAAGGTYRATMGPRVAGASNCNWLQSQENLMDPLHSVWLHSRHSRLQFPSEHYALMPEVRYEETEMGIWTLMRRTLPDGRQWDVMWELLMPMTTHLVHSELPKSEKTRTIHFCVPVDDTHQVCASVRWIPPGGDIRTARDKLAPASREDASYEHTQRYPDDKEAQEGQGPIAVHGLEHPMSSDRGVVMLRRILRREIEAVRRGQDPKGVLRDPEKAGCVPTNAGGVIRAPSVTAAADAG